ncbi:MAG TPA: HYR domain-containing protein, partial [Blastocatellia bacterium]|nr:HYR domain-containing protein [Blastocatellia bacterium]
MQPRQIVSFRTHLFSPLLGGKRRTLELMLVLLAASVIGYITFHTVEAQQTIIGPGVAQVGSAAPKSNASSNKAGSVLFFHKYTSDSTRANKVNTLVTLTNTNPTDGITVRLLAIHDCLTEDKFINLAANQSRTLLISKEFPDSTGALAAVAVTPTGAPVQFNWLIGSATVSDWNGHEGSYNAFAVAKRTAGAVVGDGKTFALNFDGKQYDQLPQTIAVDNLQSPNADLTLYSPTPTLADEGGFVNAVLEASLYDSSGKAYNSKINGYTCGLYSSAADLWLDQPVNRILKGGQQGWASFTASDYSDRAKPKPLPILGVSFSTTTGKPQTGSVTMQVLDWMAQFTITLKAKVPNIPAAPEAPSTNQTDAVGGATGASESKAGSLLFYPRFVNTAQGKTQLNLTNTHPTQKARVRLFFNVVSPNSKVSEKIITIEPQQALSLNVAESTDGQRGWVMAMAIDSGAQAIKFNYLIGSAQVTESSGVTTIFNALAVGKNSEGAVKREEDDIKTAILNFDDKDFDRLPATWALSALPNQNDYNSYLSYNRFHTTLLEAPSTRGSGSITLYDKTFAVFSGLIGPAEINLEELSKIRLNPTVPATSVQNNAGWFKLSMTTPSLAVISNFATGPITPTQPEGWTGGLSGSGNLHILTSTSSYALKIPSGNPNNQPPIAEFQAFPYHIEARSAAGTIVRLDATSSSDADPEDSLTYAWYVDGAMVSNAAISDYRLGIGLHEIKLIVTDTSGEQSEPYLQGVEVKDTVEPTISRVPSSIDVVAVGNNAVVNFAVPVAYDAVDGAVRVTSSHAPGSTFALGHHFVTFTATDRAGNKATTRLDINVVPGNAASQ